VLPLIQFEDAPLGPVLEALAREIGVTLVLDPVLQPRLQETVNLRLENVSAADVLEAVLRNQGLQAVRHGRTNRLGITRR
jgi:type II secretory pathway component HofQ